MTQFATLALGLIAPSLTNPRKTFNAAKLTELAETIKASGVHQPILVRPLPAARLQDTSARTSKGPRPTHEIVAGERRYRASLEAGMPDIPVMIRELTDSQVREIQLIENLQREDLTELEEAEGYADLMAHMNITADEVAVKIKKSRSYVFGRLKLLDLGTDGRNALREGKIEASHASLIARIPDGKLQAKALKEIMDGRGYYGHGEREPMSYRQALDHVQTNYMLKLGSAKFKITNVDLVAGVGSCMSCTKRTGHNPDLFSDVKGADVCTDPPCFHKKEDAHAANVVKEAKAKGQTIIAGKEALELMPQQGYNSKFKGYKRLDDATDSPTDKPLRKIIGKLITSQAIEPIMIDHPHKKGELVAVLPNDVVARLLKEVTGQAEAAKAVSKEAQQLFEEKETKAAAKLKDQFEQGWRDELLARAWAELNDGVEVESMANVHRYLARRQLNSLSTDQTTALSKMLEVGKVGKTSGLAEYLEETKRPDHMLLLIIMLKDAHQHSSTYRGNTYVENEGLMLVAEEVFMSKLPHTLKEVKAAVKARLEPVAKAKVTPKAASKTSSGGKGEEPTAKDQQPKTSSPKPAARKAKLTAEEAITGIAVAMQGIDGAASAPVGAVALPAEPVGAIDPEKYLTAKNIVTVQRNTNPAHLVTMLGVNMSMAICLLAQMEEDGIVTRMNSDGKRTVITKEIISAQQADPIGATVLAVGVAIRVVADKNLLGPIARKYAGREGVIAKDMGEDCYQVKLAKGGSMPLYGNQIEAVAA